MAVLPVALILLAGAALILLFAQKNLLVDLQITRNGYASRIAYAAADSGLASALSRLNDIAMRKTLLTETKGTGTYDQILASEFTQSLGESVAASVTLKALSLGGSDIRLQIQSAGCVNGCTQGRAVVSQMVALRGGIHQIPAALLSARGRIDASGPVTLSNPYPISRGTLMHAGGAINHDDAVQRVSLPGQNPDLAEVAQDQQYARLSVDQFFERWFGADKPFIRDKATRLTCAGECAGSVAALGSRLIWLDGNARLSNGNLGSPEAPVIIIATGSLQLAGALRLTGIVYSMSPETTIQLGSGAVDGAVIAENALNVSQGGRLSYNPVILQRAQSSLGRFVPVPGSWSDGE
jgi:hypothetical protein